MQNPFTTTFSKIPDLSYIPTAQTNEIIDNFSYDRPSESLYKITGVRGSGKTVLLAKIEEELGNEERKKEKWRVYRLSTGRDMLSQFLAALIKDGFGKLSPKLKAANISASVLGTGGGIGLSAENPGFTGDIGVEIDHILAREGAKGYHFLIGIDEVSKTPEMIIFALEFGKWLRAGYPVYVVCTGLYENMEQLSNVRNLTFFRRATTIKTEPLNMIRMAEMYHMRLKVDRDEAKKLAGLTRGYAYAFQKLGVICFNRHTTGDMEEIIFQLKSELYAYAYEKIWEELADQDKVLIRIISDHKEWKREEIQKNMEKPQNYSVYRERLLKRGLINTRRSYISLALPFFGEYVNEFT